jgi:SUMO ligase MMS21 Smc5/6 complex component
MEGGSGMSVSRVLLKSRRTGAMQFTKDLFKQTLSDFHKPYTEKREMVIMTGAGGRDMFDEAIQKQNDLDFADFLASKSHISEDEKTRIHQMINATPDDYEVAKVILTQLSEKHFSYYHTTKRLK